MNKILSIIFTALMFGTMVIIDIISKNYHAAIGYFWGLVGFILWVKESFAHIKTKKEYLGFLKERVNEMKEFYNK
jgi:hypothetical protein